GLTACGVGVEGRERPLTCRPQRVRAVDGVDDRAERRRDDGRVNGDAPAGIVVAVRLHVGRGGRVLALRHRVLVLLAHVDLDAEPLLERVDERCDRAVSLAGYDDTPAL